MRVVAVAISLLDLPVFPVDEQLGLLLSADLSRSLNSIGLSVKMPGRAATPTFFDIPSSVRIRYNVMRFQAHYWLPSIIEVDIPIRISAPAPRPSISYPRKYLELAH